MPPLFKLLLTSLLQGVILGWTVLAILLVSNFLEVREMLFASSDKWLALFLLAFGFFVTFGSTSMGIAIMFMPYEDEDPKPRGGHKLRIKSLFNVLKAPQTVPVKVTDK